jgi:NADPH2:quinone reductase
VRALHLDRDGTWVVRDVADPRPGVDEVLVRVHAAGLNRADLMMREGTYTPLGAGWTVARDRVGFEYAGVVAARGAEAGDVRVGDRVMGQAGGSCAELVVADPQQLLPVPDGSSWVEAAALPSALLTAYDALTGPATLRPGERVLVIGATTSVGLVAVQTARALGAGRVVGTTRDPARASLVTDAGADDVLVLDGHLPGPALVERFDVVLDLVGGSSLERCLPLAARSARIAQIGRLGGGTARIDLDLLARERISLTGTTFRGRSLDELRDLSRLLRRSGVVEHVRPLVGATFGLAEAEAAAAAMVAPGTRGKVVLTPVTTDIS